jgi:hypothetical protein
LIGKGSYETVELAKWCLTTMVVWMSLLVVLYIGVYTSASKLVNNDADAAAAFKKLLSLSSHVLVLGGVCWTAERAFRLSQLFPATTVTLSTNEWFAANVASRLSETVLALFIYFTMPAAAAVAAGAAYVTKVIDTDDVSGDGDTAAADEEGGAAAVEMPPAHKSVEI